ncbi:MAG: cysteine methyltransferase [Candidatus Kerfeldbacteria bacterium CG_4_10_14_0_8_um_filter_42_10]|uniref:Cysteine methyltransferase n=1 Tax=Candidatus Kerfeldbacteria bacterium CG_4_10_14_0_8_um_filter_42_10 TaxID=2014248 RepID=A0A2M7RJT7_9BACT|nr:MAG: cysteine methyltransferase [Candidatus Kerfeldbacteria bacterium CG_4_10_14_0_8_um_filter_42_10]
MSQSFFDKVYQIVKRVPKGKVATYGQIAALAGSPRSARMVGWALHQINDRQAKEIPWQRIINREGRISTTCLDHPPDLQKFLLVNEGVEVKDREGNSWIDLEKFLWKP